MGVELAAFQHRPELPLDGAAPLPGGHVADDIPGAVEDLHRIVAVGVGIFHRPRRDLDRRPHVVPVEVDAADAA